MISGSIWLDLSLFLGVASVIFYFFVKERNLYFKKRNIAHRKPFLIFGNIFDNVFFRKNFFETINDIYKEFHGERLVGFFQLLQPSFIICDPALVNKVLVQEFSHFHDRGVPVDEETNPLDGNLFNLSGSKWKTLRNKMIPTFTSGKLKGMLPLMDQCVDLLMNKLEQQVGEEVEMKDLFSRLTIEVIVITDEVLTAQSFVFFLAGFETSATGLTFVSYMLSKHPDVQEKLRQHVREVKKKHGSISYTAIKDMDFLEACIKETLRMYPPIIVLIRKCNRDIELGGVHIDAGTGIAIPVKGLHRDKDLFRDPDTFLPERFLTDTVVPGSFLPFGDGPRLCIGQRFAMLEMKLTLARLVDRFKIETCPTMKSHEPLEFKKFSFIPNTVHGIHCRMVKAP